MKATLLDLVLDVAASLFTDVAQHLAQHPLECIVLHGATLGAIWRGYSRETIITDIKGGAEHVTTLAGSIAIASLQTSHIVLSPKHTRHDDAM